MFGLMNQLLRRQIDSNKLHDASGIMTKMLLSLIDATDSSKQVIMQRICIHIANAHKTLALIKDGQALCVLAESVCSACVESGPNASAGSDPLQCQAGAIESFS